MQIITFPEVRAERNGYPGMLTTGPINAFVFGQLGIVVDDDCRLIVIKIMASEARGGSLCGTFAAYRGGCRCASCRAAKRVAR